MSAHAQSLQEMSLRAHSKNVPVNDHMQFGTSFSPTESALLMLEVPVVHSTQALKAIEKSVSPLCSPL